jgi:glyoxylase-like metal-dependent hydrolase (beta-lactamase superfamily II)
MPPRRDLGRGERVLPGLWRLRLPLPWPGIPHCNAWALANGDGFVLVDTGMYDSTSMGHLERALHQVKLELENASLLVITHAHSDHWGQSAPIVERAGCEMWMHPNHEAQFANLSDPDRALTRRMEVARHSGVPDGALTEYVKRVKDMPSGVAETIEPNQPLVDGVTVDSDLGTWQVIETPGHTPSHVCLFQPERRLLISGDHLLGRICPRWTRSREPARGWRCRATASRSSTCPVTSTGPGGWSSRTSSAQRRRSPASRARR